MTRTVGRITATTDFHSEFADAGPMLAHLRAARPDSLLVDCGDFFEGTGYYRLGGGSLEQAVLAELYDAIAPGNHGWRHHFEPSLRPITVCANAVDDAGRPLFQQLIWAQVGGRRVAVTAVIGVQAFASIPPGERHGHAVTDPAGALRRLFLEHHHQADAWVLLSHQGFLADLELAEQCPFLDVVFAGHCHSDQYAPVPVANALVLKGRELGAGYALAEPVGSGWAAHTCTFDGPAALAGMDPIGEAVARLTVQLREPVSAIAPAFRHTLLDRRRVLAETADRLREELRADAVVLNEYALRAVALGDRLTCGELLAIEPFDNQLVSLDLDGAPLDTEALTLGGGPLVTSAAPLPGGPRSIVTTDYLASYLAGRTAPAHMSLATAVQRTLAEAAGHTGGAP